ncbi:Protein kinase domain [Dillenia turbinata]|uniref:Protein kinase domain n=1 Tax=Dillenia turbinata TaxID=194707 RepID=A0AAN8UYX1_9MAGN
MDLGKNPRLIFLSEVTPSPGTKVSLVARPLSLQKGTSYWVSSNPILSSVPEMRSTNFNYSYISNYPTTLLRFIMDISGQMKSSVRFTPIAGHLESAVRTPCTFVHVNGYEMKSSSDWNLGDYSSGCRRTSASANGAKDKFLPLSSMKLPDNSISMPAEDPPFPWRGAFKGVGLEARFQIALRIARGLAYPNEKCRDCIIHCDIKPENILLDADFCPEVADFGLAELVSRDFSWVLTTFIRLSCTRVDFGCSHLGQSQCLDYGMMPFEIISDPKLEGSAEAEELRKVCEVACWCIQDDEIHMPTMDQVAQTLEGILDVKAPPLPRSLQIFLETPEDIIFFSKLSSSQS